MSTTHQQSAGAPRPAGEGRTDLPPNHVDPEVLEHEQTRWTPLRIVIWVGIALLGAIAWAMIAFARGESINAIWFVFAAVCSYFIAYRARSWGRCWPPRWATSPGPSGSSWA